MKKAFLVIALALGLTTVSGAFNEAVAQKKSSSRKKDAIIGGVVGAGTGAIVSHKKAKGAIIGGALGAGAGYMIGRHKDKKKGQLQKKQ